MPQHCPSCNGELTKNGVCVVLECDYEPPGLSRNPPANLNLAKAPVAGRLGGAGLEMFTFFVLDIIGLLLSPFTAMVSGMLTGLAAALYMGIKDLNGGHYSIGKRIAGVHVVDAKTGQPASRGQAVLRNSPYIAGWLLAVMPDPFGMVGWAVIFVALIVDTLMIVASPEGKRSGDLLAGTQIVPTKPR
jgi:uncharacterized RDD family membrane protein YckC